MQKGVCYLVVFIKKMGSRQQAVKVFFAVCEDTILDDISKEVFSFKRTSRVFQIKISAKGHFIYIF
jgi:hypothetical protein